MSPQPLLLDTGIVVALIRGDSLGQAVRDRFDLDHHLIKPFVAVVSVGECLAIAKHGEWGEKKSEKLRSLIASLTVVRLTPRVRSEYAGIACWLRRSPYTIGQNDMWIAAAARSAGARVVTTDSDFDRLAPEFLERTRFAPRTGELLVDG